MKIIRWILSHTFLILLIVLVIYGYMFWGNLLGKDTPAGKAIAYLSSEFVVVDEFMNAVREKQAGLKTARNQAAEESGTVSLHRASEDRPVTDPVPDNIQAAAVNDASEAVHQPGSDVETSASNEQDALQAAETIPDEDTLGEVDDADASTADLALPVPQGALIQGEIPRQTHGGDATVDSANAVTASDTEVASPVDIAPAQESATVDETETFVSAEIEKQLDNVDDSGRVIDEAQKLAVVRDNWITARKSFYQRRYDLCEKSYQFVINNTRDNHDAYGELGNVYFNQGKNEQAAAAYFEAAAILVKKGQIRRARSLVGLLRHLDETRASELQQLIESAAT